jgi:hypothetical protein
MYDGVGLARVTQVAAAMDVATAAAVSDAKIELTG